jgi:hypothetical protein
LDHQAQADSQDLGILRILARLRTRQQAVAPPRGLLLPVLSSNMPQRVAGPLQYRQDIVFEPCQKKYKESFHPEIAGETTMELKP